MALPRIMGEFRVGGDPDLRFTPNGRPVAGFSVIADARRKNESTDEWETTAETGWLRVNVWGAPAERVANEVTKGSKVFLVGRYKARKYTDRDGEERTSHEIDADAIEVIDRPQRSEGTTSQAAAPTGPGDDPWAAPAPAPQDDEAPF